MTYHFRYMYIYVVLSMDSDMAFIFLSTKILIWLALLYSVLDLDGFFESAWVFQYKKKSISNEYLHQIFHITWTKYHWWYQYDRVYRHDTKIHSKSEVVSKHMAGFIQKW